MTNHDKGAEDQEKIIEEIITASGDKDRKAKKDWPASWWGKTIFVGVLAVCVSGFIVGGYVWGFDSGYSETKNINITGIANGSTPSNVDADFSLFWQEWSLLKNTDLNAKSVTDQQMMYGAMTGLANAYNDPYTVFFDPADSTEFLGDVNGNFGGIGAEIS